MQFCRSWILLFLIFTFQHSTAIAADPQTFDLENKFKLLQIWIDETEDPLAEDPLTQEMVQQFRNSAYHTLNLKLAQYPFGPDVFVPNLKTIYGLLQKLPDQATYPVHQRMLYDWNELNPEQKIFWLPEFLISYSSLNIQLNSDQFLQIFKTVIDFEQPPSITATTGRPEAFLKNRAVFASYYLKYQAYWSPIIKTMTELHAPYLLIKNQSTEDRSLLMAFLKKYAGDVPLIKIQNSLNIKENIMDSYSLLFSKHPEAHTRALKKNLQISAKLFQKLLHGSPQEVGFVDWMMQSPDLLLNVSEWEEWRQRLNLQLEFEQEYYDPQHESIRPYGKILHDRMLLKQTDEEKASWLVSLAKDHLDLIPWLKYTQNLALKNEWINAQLVTLIAKHFLENTQDRLLILQWCAQHADALDTLQPNPTTQQMADLLATDQTLNLGDRLNFFSFQISYQLSQKHLKNQTVLSWLQKTFDQDKSNWIIYISSNQKQKKFSSKTQVVLHSNFFQKALEAKDGNALALAILKNYLKQPVQFVDIDFLVDQLIQSIKEKKSTGFDSDFIALYSSQYYAKRIKSVAVFSASNDQPSLDHLKQRLKTAIENLVSFHERQHTRWVAMNELKSIKKSIQSNELELMLPANIAKVWISETLKQLNEKIIQLEQAPSNTSSISIKDCNWLFNPLRWN
jgi:hypothetical protein